MKEYEEKYPKTWWLTNRNYFIYFTRELTGIIIAIYALLSLYMLYMVKTGVINQPFIQIYFWYSWFTFVIAIYHGLTWFYSMTKITSIKLGGFKIPHKFLWAGSLIVWIVVSYFVNLILYSGLLGGLI